MIDTRWTYSVTPRFADSDEWFYVTLDQDPSETWRDWDGIKVWNDRETMQQLADHLNHGPLTMEAHICDQRRSYVVSWQGTDADVDTRAAEWMKERGMRYAFLDIEEYPVNWTRFPKVYAYLYPTCDHGLSLAGCYDPINHF